MENLCQRATLLSCIIYQGFRESSHSTRRASLYFETHNFPNFGKRGRERLEGGGCEIEQFIGEASARVHLLAGEGEVNMARGERRGGVKWRRSGCVDGRGMR